MHFAPDQPAIFNTTIDRERNRLRTEIVGRIELPQVEEYVARKVGEGIMPFAELLDARLASTAVSAHDIHHLVDVVRRLASATSFGQVAVVVADNVTYGMARMMSTLIEGTVSIQPFHEIEKAEEWLGWKGET